MTIKRKNEIIQILLDYIEGQTCDYNQFADILDALGISPDEIHDI